jgi:RNA polymerase sigma-70 factor (ECF subfamily)
MVRYGLAVAGATAFGAPFGAALDLDGDEHDLIARLAGGDASVLGVLYDRYAAQALGLARRILGDDGPAEEVVQDAFVVAWRRASTFDPTHGGARGWLLGIVHRRAVECLRAARGAAPSVADRSRDDGAAPLRHAAARVDRRRVVDELRRLPSVQREAIELAFFDGLTHVEIAERLDQPLATVGGRIRLGLTALRRLLEESLAR